MDIINLYIDFILPEDTFFIEDFYPLHARCMRSFFEEDFQKDSRTNYSCHCFLFDRKPTIAGFILYLISRKKRITSLIKRLS